MKKTKRKSTKATGLSKLARAQGVTRQAVFNRAERARRRAEGLCPGIVAECHGRRDFNAKKGKPYALCPACRKHKAHYQKLLMRRRAKKRI